MISNKFYYIGISYLNAFGEALLQLVRKKGVSLITNLIQDVSGLRKEQKTDEELVEAYLDIERDFTSSNRLKR